MQGCRYNNTIGSLLNCSNNANKLLSFANEQQIETFLPRILDEGRFMGMAYTEPSGGSDSRAIQTTAVLDGDEWVINGTKSFISYRSAVGSWQVSAKTVDADGNEGISVFLVDAQAPGVSYGAHYDKFGWCGSDTGDVYFKDCRVPKWSVCGEVNKGLRISLSTLDNARLVIAARAVGYAEGAFEKAWEYASAREAFGRMLTDFQALQHYFCRHVQRYPGVPRLSHAPRLRAGRRPLNRQRRIHCEAEMHDYGPAGVPARHGDLRRHGLAERFWGSRATTRMRACSSQGRAPARYRRTSSSRLSKRIAANARRGKQWISR